MNLEQGDQHESIVVLMDIQNNVVHQPVLMWVFEDQHQPEYN